MLAGPVQGWMGKRVVLKGTMPRPPVLTSLLLLSAAAAGAAQSSSISSKAGSSDAGSSNAGSSNAGSFNAGSSNAGKSSSAEIPSVAVRVAGMKHIEGLLPLDWDAKAGKLYVQVKLLAGDRSADLLYTNSLPFGTGSNDLGLDRGQTAPGRIVRFERFGPKVLLVEPNEEFRTSSSDPAEQLTVRQSFPESVLFGFKVEAESADSPAGSTVLVDATELFVRDVHGVSEALARTQQGAYKVDVSRSAIAMDSTKAFPKNTEVEAVLTFTTDGPARGEWVRDVAPDAHAITLREHQSFLELPPPGFTSRRFDPRAGYFPESFRNYSASLGEPLDQQFILRHRLIKRDPACKTNCEPVQPIQYYVDRGAPEPIRSALLEGARWWNQAFTAAGWQNAFRVDVLPADADPMDVRYNIIQWVHRYTRGWSYGAAVADPRTGEIIKGNVTLGSLRGRQDYLIAEALLAPYSGGKAWPPNGDPKRDPMLQMVLARIRQLAAHETGHTLGLAHNFAASSCPHRPEESVSVMDYPHPWITLGKGGVPEISQAYAVNIGEWDKVAIDYGYREFDKGRQPAEDVPGLEHILAESQRRGLIFITDEDSRPMGSAHPHAHLWDNGADPAEELNRLLEVRSAALRRFGEAVIRPGTATAQMEDTLVPLYLLHRYQTEAAAKEIGGLDYRYTLRGDGQPGPRIVLPEDQRKALAAVLKTISAETLTLPEALLQRMPPRPPGLDRTRESFAAASGLSFDPIAAAESSADLTLALLLNPQRASRLVEYHARNPENPGLDGVIDQLLTATWKAPAASGLALEVQHAVQTRTVEALLTLAASPTAAAEAAAIARDYVLGLKASLHCGAPESRAHCAANLARIDAFERDPSKFVAAKPVEAPPGMPIGDEDEF